MIAIINLDDARELRVDTAVRVDNSASPKAGIFMELDRTRSEVIIVYPVRNTYGVHPMKLRLYWEGQKFVEHGWSILENEQERKRYFALFEKEGLRVA